MAINQVGSTPVANLSAAQPVAASAPTGSTEATATTANASTPTADTFEPHDSAHHGSSGIPGALLHLATIPIPVNVHVSPAVQALGGVLSLGTVGLDAGIAVKTAMDPHASGAKKVLADVTAGTSALTVAAGIADAPVATVLGAATLVGGIIRDRLK